MTWRELKELIKNMPDDQEVTLIRVADDNYYYKLEHFLLDDELVIRDA